MALALCIAGFLACFLLGRRSLSAGLGGVLTMGYFYGILRANYLDSFAHFMFDCAVVGFYLSLLVRKPDRATIARTRDLQRWVVALIGWAVVMFLIPMQHPLIQLVGLRGNGFLVPFLLVGSWLERKDAERIALWLATLNLVAFAFALGEYRLGIRPFFPVNAVTEIIYKSGDLVGWTAHRIPACFANAHSYAGTMVATIPWLLGAWIQAGKRLGRHCLFGSAVAAAVIGTFMSAARVHAVVLFLLIFVFSLSGKLRGGYWLAWLLILGGIGYLVSGEERMQRFLTLGDTESVQGRIQGSLNLTLMDLLFQYPMGNGMGAGGTSIPYFLQSLLTNPIGLESEYSRLLLEQGLPGLLLWVGFIGWLVLKWPAASRDRWLLGRRLMWVAALASFATGLIGTGLLTSIPQSVLLFVGIGFLTTRQREPRRAPAPVEEVECPVPAKV
jgi:hypothetical protein